MEYQANPQPVMKEQEFHPLQAPLNFTGSSNALPAEPKKEEEKGFEVNLETQNSAANSILSKHKLSVASLEYRTENTIQDMMEAAKVLVESGILPNHITEPEQVVAITKFGSELGIQAMSAINNIHMIEGKPTLNIHLIGALLKKKKFGYKILADFAAYGQGDAITTIRFYDEAKLEHYRKSLKEVDKFPTIAQEAYVRSLDELRESAVQDFSFTYSEANAMGLLSKGNWKKMPKIMMRSRCLALGARFVAPDAVMGMMETAEAADTFGYAVEVDEEGMATVME